MSAPAATTDFAEQPGFLQHGPDPLYYVLHRARGTPTASVLLCGPVGGARERAYRTFVEVARRLARDGFASMRFDYRGIGESGPEFERFTMTHWRADVERCAAFLRGQHPGVPLLLVGLRASAILVSECFRDGLADAAMLASPMGTGQALLQDILRRHLMADMLANPGAPRVPREEIIETLQRGEHYNIDGYLWSRELWEDAARHVLAVPGGAEPRPWWIVDFAGLPKTPVPAAVEQRRVVLQSDRFWEASANLVPRTPAFADLVSRCATETSEREHAA